MLRTLVEHLLECDRCEHFGDERHFAAVLASGTYCVPLLIHEEPETRTPLMRLDEVIRRHFLFPDCVDERVLLQDVNTITLKEGQYTTGRRVAPVPQLKCVGGGACYKYQPRVVQCVKQGYDGSDYQWKCTADMPRQYKFGMLEYELEYAEPAKEVGRSKMKWPSLFSWPRWLTSENIVNVIVVLFIIYVIYSMLSSSGSPGRTTPRYGWFGGGFDGGPGFGGGYPGAHPRPSAPPSYEDTMGFKSAYSTPSSSSGPGFWTGAGLGALGGYLFGRNTRADEHFVRTADANYADFDQPSSSEMRESTGKLLYKFRK
ncbi:unnamed protein product [Angiostrongylus costaricensis]|uniref:Store-operated calcium entry-associated regulatory factor n=1 Tax=Angiostrongylus costaricensis TaxID=334426 RepID=A0A0R3PYJ7_ANGCS|nr:unnamed protein product [Angiostrongylus costaricensis]